MFLECHLVFLYLRLFLIWICLFYFDISKVSWLSPVHAMSFHAFRCVLVSPTRKNILPRATPFFFKLSIFFPCATSPWRCLWFLKFIMLSFLVFKSIKNTFMCVHPDTHMWARTRAHTQAHTHSYHMSGFALLPVTLQRQGASSHTWPFTLTVSGLLLELHLNVNFVDSQINNVDFYGNFRRHCSCPYLISLFWVSEILEDL